MGLSEKEQERLIEAFKGRDRVVTALSEDGFFRVTMIKNTKSAQDAQRKHNLTYYSAFLLSRALAASSMMASFLKGQERISLEFTGDGAIRKVFAEALQVGEQRGFIEYLDDVDKMRIESTNDLLGNGNLSVVRFLYNKKEPIKSVIPLYHGDIATDVAYYYAQSEQVPTAVILDVDFDDDGIVRQSAGLMVQALPGAKDNDIKIVYNELSNIKSLVSYFEDNYTPDKAMKELLPFDFDLISSTQVDFFCRCSKESFIDKLITLDIREIEDMQNKEQNELVCRYCNEKYHLEKADFDSIKETIVSKNN